jgi:hypothetical protein
MIEADPGDIVRLKRMVTEQRLEIAGLRAALAEVATMPVADAMACIAIAHTALDIDAQGDPAP